MSLDLVPQHISTSRISFRVTIYQQNMFNNEAKFLTSDIFYQHVHYSRSTPVSAISNQIFQIKRIQLAFGKDPDSTVNSLYTIGKVPNQSHS